MDARPTLDDVVKQIKTDIKDRQERLRQIQKRTGELVILREMGKDVDKVNDELTSLRCEAFVIKCSMSKEEVEDTWK